MRGRKFASVVGLTVLLSVAAAGPASASTIVPEGVDDAWHNQPVMVTFKVNGQPVVTQYRLNTDAYWHEGDSLAVSAEGVTSLAYLSTDQAGTVLPVKDSTFTAEVLQHPGLVMAEFWAPW